MEFVKEKLELVLTEKIEVPKVVAVAAGGFALAFAWKKLRAYTVPKVWDQETIRTNHGTNHSEQPNPEYKKEAALPRGAHKYQLYSMSTPNGVKATIMLEEVCAIYKDFDYDAWRISIDGPQFGSGFVAVNPNSKIPALMDYDVKGEPIRVFESGAILVHLAEKFPKCNLLPKVGDPMRTECLAWVFWAIASPPFLGGGFGHFYGKRTPEACAKAGIQSLADIEYPLNRYAMETKRQLDLLDKHLKDNKYICGDKYTIADIAIWPWYGATALGRMYSAKEFLDVDKYTNLKRWATMLETNHPALAKGRMVNRSGRGDTEANPIYKKLPDLRERHSRDDWNHPEFDKDKGEKGGWNNKEGKWTSLMKQ